MHVTMDSIREAYRRYSRFYDLTFGPILQPGRKAAVRNLECRPGDRVLEVGVGTGLSLDMYPAGVKVVGIDVSEEMLGKARARAAREDFAHVEGLFRMDAQEMDFRDDEFDKVVAMYVATVVPDPRALVREIRRVCKPGGTIIFVNHFQNKNPWIRKAESLLQPFARHVGFHPDFPLEKFVKETRFKFREKIPVNAFDYWTILVGHNSKKSRALH